MNSKKPAKRVEIVSLRMVRENTFLYKDRKINSPKEAVEIVKGFLENEDREKFVVINLDTKNQPTHLNIASIGSLSATIVHPREIFKTAILTQSAGIILSHNHPSGDPSPSQEDIEVTSRLVEAGNIIGIRIIDHIIVGNNDRFFSFKENGLI